MNSISCMTPACVAGHIVDDAPKLQEELTLQLAGREITDENALKQTASAIHEIEATELRTPAYPVLFQTEWPVVWLEQVGR